LGSLQTVGRLEISNNAQLATVTGVAAATIRGDLVLRGNPKLTQLGSWTSLSRVEGALTVDDNDGLTSLGGFSSLTAVTGALTITNNGAVTALDPLGHLQAIGSSISVTGNGALDGCRGWEIYYCVPHNQISMTVNNNKPNTGGGTNGNNCPRFW